MAAKNFLRNIAGVISEAVGVVTSAGATNAGDIPALDGTGRLDASVLPVGIGADVNMVTASEAITAPALVNVYNNAGTAAVRKADASVTGKEANGFILTTVSSGAAAAVYSEGTVTGLTGLTAGRQYLSATTPGQPVATSPTASGQISQFVGTAVSATQLNFEADQPITIA